MLKSLITDTVTDVVECVPKNFAHICKTATLHDRT
jgi:hypothetical protein